MTRPEVLSRQSTYKAPMIGKAGLRKPGLSRQSHEDIELVKALALAGKIDEARGVIEAINDPYYKARGPD